MSENPVRSASEKAAKEIWVLKNTSSVPSEIQSQMADIIESKFAPVVAAAEEAMKEKCAGAVCEWCRKGFLVIEYKVSNANGWFYHKPDPLGLALTCVAHPIRAIPTGTALAENSLKAQLAEAERKAYLKVRQALEGAGDAPIPEGVCSNEDQEEGFSDGVCCTLNLIWKAIASLEKSAALSAPVKDGEKQ